MLTLTHSDILVANYYDFPFYVDNDIIIEFCILSILRFTICNYKPYAFNRFKLLLLSYNAVL